MSRRRRPADPAIESHAPEQRRLPLTRQQQTLLMQAAQRVAAAQAEAQAVLLGVLAAAGIEKARIVESAIEEAAPYIVVQVLLDA